jgi:hypothetical protein
VAVEDVECGQELGGIQDVESEKEFSGGWGESVVGEWVEFWFGMVAF